MEQRLISFKRFKAHCNGEYDGRCMDGKAELKCNVKNCPVWRKLRSLEEATLFPKKSVFKTIR